MPAYSFEALDSQGHIRRGTLDADSPKAARNLLRAQALGPLAQLELTREDTQEVIEVVMPSQEFDRLRARGCQHFIARPSRARVFFGSSA